MCPTSAAPTAGSCCGSGLTLAIEPMLTTGGEDTRTLNDGWTVVTADGSLAAHFEHTVAVTPEGGRCVDAATGTRVRIVCSAHASGVRCPRVRRSTLQIDRFQGRRIALSMNRTG